MQEWHSVGTNRATNAAHTINFSGGSLTYNVNQQANGGKWNTLGTFYFAAGGGNVVINAAGANGTVVIADAVRFTYLNATAPTTVTYDSVSGDDGWVLESTETSGVGGSINSANTTLNIGDDATKKQYMGILSFDTSPIPDGATIQKVTLKVTRSSLAGAPYSTLGTLTVDIKPAYFGTATTLATNDFASAAGATSVATVTAPSGNNVTVSAAPHLAGRLPGQQNGQDTTETALHHRRRQRRRRRLPGHLLRQLLDHDVLSPEVGNPIHAITKTTALNLVGIP